MIQCRICFEDFAWDDDNLVAMVVCKEKKGCERIGYCRYLSLPNST